MELVIKGSDELEIVSQRSQLGRTPQLQLHAFIQIERLIERVCLHSQDIAFRSPLKKREAVSDLRWVAAQKQVLVVAEALRLDKLRILQFFEKPEDLVLQGDIQSCVGVQVQAIKCVQVRYPQVGQ